MKKLITLVLSAAMLLSLLCVTAFAEGTEIPVADAEELLAAITNASEGDTIKLTGDIEYDSWIQVNKPITLDLNGYTITYTGVEVESGFVFLWPGADLTVKDTGTNGTIGTINSGNMSGAIVLWGDGNTPVILTIDGGKLIGKEYAISGNGMQHNTKITVNDGVLTSDSLCIYHPQIGELTVNGGTFTAPDSAIEMRSGSLTINGGTFTATKDAFSCEHNGNGTTTSGAAIAIAQHTTKNPISVTIKGGTFTGVKALNESNPENNPAPQVTMSIQGGTFTGDVTVADATSKFITGGTFSENVAEYIDDAEVAEVLIDNTYYVGDAATAAIKALRPGQQVTVVAGSVKIGLITLEEGKTYTYPKNNNKNNTTNNNNNTNSGTTITQSPKTADAGIAVYGVMSVMSLLGMGYVSKRKSR